MNTRALVTGPWIVMRETARSGRVGVLAAGAIAAIALALLPNVLRAPAAIPVVNQMGISVIFALSYNMLIGQGGMLSFGHAVYLGMGGFVAATR